jgi:endonuclease III
MMTHSKSKTSTKTSTKIKLQPASTVIEIFKRFQAADPTPTTELAFKNNFELLVAVLLSAQATDVSVNKATPALFKAAPTPEAMMRLGVEGLKPYIKTIGLYNTKAKHLIEAATLLVELHDGEVPSTREALEGLPGVGRKTANVVLNTAFGIPTIAVDTHIFRVAKRLGLATASTPLGVEQELEKIVPNEFRKDAHHWLILHGRYTCVARTPRCFKCIISDLCPFKPKVEAPCS